MKIKFALVLTLTCMTLSFASAATAAATAEAPSPAAPETRPVLLGGVPVDRLTGEVVCIYNFSSW